MWQSSAIQELPCPPVVGLTVSPIPFDGNDRYNAGQQQ